MIDRLARSSLVAAVVAAGVMTPAVTGVAETAATPDTAGPTVTLLTGDTVTLGGADGVDVRAAKGRERVSFITRTDEQGDLHVIPEDALSLVSSGKLDPRLFDVTELARDGYGDESRDTLPLIVDYKGATPRSAGVRVTRELPAMSAVAVSAERSSTSWATVRDAERVWLDGRVRASLDHSVPQIGAPQAWAGGHTGAGTTVAVLDTGIDATHPDLSDAVVGTENFSDSDTGDDRHGHGTHVASTITGSGAASGGRYQGVAPDAKLLNGKVLNDGGNGQESWIIAGMEWAAANGADVVNMSLGSRAPSDGTDPMSQAVNRITEETGTLFVIAAGNMGQPVGSPGAADAALTVGAVDRNDQLAIFSSRGRLDGAVKPELTAPGVEIVAARAKNAVFGDPADSYAALSGTSMASPHVAGAAAILAGVHPDWNADQLKATLTGTARPTEGLSVFAQGAGRVDVAKATTTSVFTTPATVNYGTAQWPHDDDQPITRTVTYTNTGAEPVTLDLSVAATGPDGSAAPQGMFTAEPAKVTVPAGGQASADVTVDTAVDAAEGDFGGVLTATGAGLSVRTPVGVHRESERYNVTVKVIDHNGAPTDWYAAVFMDVNQRRMIEPYDPSGTVVARLPKGEYWFNALVQDRSEKLGPMAIFEEPAFVVTGDSTLVIDAREAKPVGFTVDRPNARTGAARVRTERVTAWGRPGLSADFDDFDDVTVKPSTTTKEDGYTFVAEERVAEWNGTSFAGSPYLYHVRHIENGAVPETLRWTVHDRQLAQVRGEHAMATPGTIGIRENFLPVSLPSTLTEYYTPDVPWEGQLRVHTDLEAYPVAWLTQEEPRTYKVGRPTTVRWNTGVFGPAFPNEETLYAAARIGNGMNVQLPLVTDQGAGRRGEPWGDGVTTLLRDGQVVAESPLPGRGFFTLPPERAQYTLRASATQPADRLSTSVSAEWTFTSEQVNGDEHAHMPLLAVRFAPDLDANNAAPAGKRFTIPVSVERNRAPLGSVHTPTVEVSYDDGGTWQATNVKRHHGKWTVTVDHPAGAEFVSLRTSVSDPDGNSEKVTIIRAYALR
jgi:subtilisin family serine protease